MKYGYYPGCSLGKSAKPYDDSTKAIADQLGMTFEEIEDWNCCGATEYFSLNKTAAYALVARNLALAADQDSLKELVAPCSACYLNLRKTDDYMGKFPKVGEMTNEALAAGGLSYEPGSLRVRHLLDVVVDDIGFENIREKVTTPLTNLWVAPYYGCMVVRPEFGDNELEDAEYPLSMDHLMEALGATVVDFPLKTHCCGGHMTQISSETAFELIRQLLHTADEANADVIVTICPMCQLNLDAYQTQVNRHFGTNYKLPILYFTQLIGLAMGIPAKKLGIGKEFVSASPALKKIGLELEEEPAPAGKRKKDDKSLPMPSGRVEG